MSDKTKQNGRIGDKMNSLVRCRACCEMVKLQKIEKCVAKHQADYRQPSFWVDDWECPKCGERGQTPNKVIAKNSN